MTEAGLRTYNLLMLRTPLTWVLFAAMLAACSAANRAAVHEDDMKKVFPWPRGKTSVTIRVKPLTTMARTCFLFGSFRTSCQADDGSHFFQDGSKSRVVHIIDRVVWEKC